MPARTTILFDAGRGYAPITNLRTLVDCTVARRGERWWMFACGLCADSWEIQMFSAALPPGAPLSATGWQITPDAARFDSPALLAGKSRSYAWDGAGGRHCPAYVRGFDPQRKAWVERIYYAGAAQHYLGPYAIGYLEWDGGEWRDQPEPALTAAEPWEHGSLYEPNVIYHDGKWKLWYVAGANQDDYLVQGYAESSNGRGPWSARQIVFPPEAKVFDFCVTPVASGFEAVFSRVDVRAPEAARRHPRSGTGLWWCRAPQPSPVIADWTAPVRIAPPGPWKPVLRYDPADPNTVFIFHDGAYPNPAAERMPLHFTLNCLEVPRPLSAAP
ncbi:MAG: hypothetical protein ACRD2E_01495 [Terriglobales bacterium]